MPATKTTSELGTYLSQVGQLPVLTAEAKLRHCRRVQEMQAYILAGETPPKDVERRGRHSIDVMLRTNLRLVITIARGYLNRGLDLQDVIQEGNIGLLTAIKRFDPERGYAFSTYAYWWIRQAITRGLLNDVRTIRVPVHAQEDIRRIRTFMETYPEGAEPPTGAEIAEATGLTLRRVNYLQNLATTKACLSLDYSAINPDVDIATLHEVVAAAPCESNSPEVALENTLTGSTVYCELQLLDPLQQAIITECYFNNRPIAEVATSLGIKKSRAAMLRRRALARLRTGILMSAMGN